MAPIVSLPPPDAPAPCLCFGPRAAGDAAPWAGGLTLPRPALDDVEGPRLPEALPPVVDAHVHLFPDPIFEAVWRWFDAYGWPTAGNASLQTNS